ncbi:c-type cytochrome [Acidiphilium sp. 34-64-41]|uniref:c-type cytochrome n=1 Tax=Acidiphilium sp. 34-64-41 TaxID=1970297 RepID=UPI000BD96E19|nr:c-type cytochrome [Acidiphilium sp. 34-64-41]OZB25179.1 MAG: cytochrome C [Acidiphilium sp. 34-64-41]
MKIRSIPTIIGAGVLGVAAVALVTMASYAADTSGTTTATSMPKGETLAKGSDCFSCHAINQKIVGPAFNWGNVPMPAHPQLSAADTKEIVSWILTLKKPGTTAASGAASGQKFTYTVKGKTVTTSFPIFQKGTDKVTPMVFRGYELFNSYCFRCHGADADGGSYAPNLRNSLNNGMTESKFLGIAMTGVKAKGMPSWAGFFTPHQIKAIYQYTDARAVAVVSQGTPKH